VLLMLGIGSSMLPTFSLPQSECKIIRFGPM
jgi:hypothetical protein